MASRITYPIGVSTPGTVAIEGSWQCNGVGAPLLPRGTGFAVARTGVGEFTVTFDRPYLDFIRFDKDLALNAVTDHQAQLGPYVAAARTLIVNTVDMGAAAVVDVAAHANNRCGFEAVFKNVAY